MARRDMPPTSSKALLDADVDYADDELPVRTPLRFGRLVLWVASASALAVGVAGTVAYRAWFSHDQREYVEAMTSARETLGLSQAALAQQTLSSGTVDTSPPPTHVVELASADTAAPNPPETLVAPPPPAPPLVAVVPNRSPAATAKPPAAQTVSARSNRPPGQTQAVAQNRHRSTQHAKPASQSLFARMGSFFHRVSYRQNVNGSQRDEYSHQ
jgi:hypothetical protein